MNDETIEQLVKFIKINSINKKYRITWFGGEPLLCLPVIERILSHLSAEKEYKLITHSIITNGTLLNEHAIELFNKYSIDSIQITFDGIRQSHDKKRYFSTGKGSFDLIVSNIKLFLGSFPTTHIDFRINVDNSNSSEYIEMRSFLLEEFKGYNIHVYPGILRANRSCEDDTFFTSEQHLEFSKMLWSNNIHDIYPTHCSKGCCATSLSSHVVGPDGELYVCWEHVGIKDKIVGYIDGRHAQGSEIYALYKLKGNCFEDPRCLACGLLPLCSGGCPDKRIKNLTENSGYNLCTIYNEKDCSGLASALYEYYLTTISKNQRDG